MLLTLAWMAESDKAEAWFGASVSSAGDVNGDGFGDVAVGASRYDDESAGGIVEVYLGSATGLDAIPAFTAEAGQPYVWFGSSVASAGDVNGDGYWDLVVGSYGYDFRAEDG